MTPARRVHANPLVASDGLSAWATVQLDGLIGSGVVDADQLDGLTTVQLSEVARRAVRATCAAQPFDATDAIEMVKRQPYRRRAA